MLNFQLTKENRFWRKGPCSSILWDTNQVTVAILSNASQFQLSRSSSTNCSRLVENATNCSRLVENAINKSSSSESDSTTTASSNVSPNDSNLVNSTASPTSVFDASDSSSTTTSSDTPPYDSNPNASSSESAETFEQFWKEDDSRTVRNLEQHFQNYTIYSQKYCNLWIPDRKPSSMWFFAGIERRKRCKKVRVPGVCL
ncbi:predicted protein [Chaetoceros tenuissimus]|uniref:Uncharacterized protein n=1 Tax=Chaetoceros tenuissimus TaxID=426638 RepID=A0AAD3D6V5_9STRA|nr:predicted protein [Chaetoceros tenuissimus]